MEINLRVIPGYENYAVCEVGLVLSIERNIFLQHYLLNGYLAVDTFRGSITETLPLHRAVALAWVINEDPINFSVVNHKDGDPLNNHRLNLEWTTYSGNNLHAINNGLRPDNIPCKIRDFFTGEIHYFASISQANVFMGISRETPVEHLKPKLIGRLVANKYEFKFSNENTPWFYENREALVKPSRFMVTVINEDKTTNEVFSNRTLLKQYQLYDSEDKSIPGLVDFARKIYPEKEFSVLDGYSQERYFQERNTNPSIRISVLAINGNKRINFDSLRKCSDHFNVDRSSILNRLDNGKNLNGWTFSTQPC